MNEGTEPLIFGYPTAASPAPRVSVVIPTLNEERDLPNLLHALRAQTFQDFDVVVADAGSPDNTRNIAHAHDCRIVEGGLPGRGRRTAPARHRR